MSMRIFSNLIFRNEELPKKTGLGGAAIQPQKPLNLVQPNTFIEHDPAVKANLKEFHPINPPEIRAEAMAKLSQQVEEVNRQIAGSMHFSGIRFGVHEESGRSFAVIRDRDSGNVIKQIPAEAFLEIAARLREASGLFVDTVG
jgi:uncharacterized FlaG/YvyC family protein